MKVFGDVVGYLLRYYNFHLAFNVILCMSACTPMVYMVGAKELFNRATLGEKRIPQLLMMMFRKKRWHWDLIFDKIQNIRWKVHIKFFLFNLDRIIFWFNLVSLNPFLCFRSLNTKYWISTFLNYPSKKIPRINVWWDNWHHHFGLRCNPPLHCKCSRTTSVGTEKTLVPVWLDIWYCHYKLRCIPLMSDCAYYFCLLAPLIFFLCGVIMLKWNRNCMWEKMDHAKINVFSLILRS